jgi:hypothetical protein
VTTEPELPCSAKSRLRLFTDDFSYLIPFGLVRLLGPLSSDEMQFRAPCGVWHA